jgi:DHA1 family inner membrane transport protein
LQQHNSFSFVEKGGSLQNHVFSRSQVTILILNAVIASCVPALQPLLLGSLLSDGRIDGVTMGYAATAEGVGMVFGTLVAGALLKPRHLRLIGAFAVCSVIIANLMTISLPPLGIVAARGVSGIGNGVLVWLTIGMLVRSANPTRLYAIYITGNALLVFALSAFLARLGAVSNAAAYGYGLLVLMYVALLVGTRLIPKQYADLAGGKGNAGLPPPSGLLALVAVTLFFIGVMGFWVYSVQLGAQAGIPAVTMRDIVSAAIGAQIIAGLIAIWLATKLTGKQVMLMTSFFVIVAVVATSMTGNAAAWLVALSILSFCWMFGSSFHIAFLNKADPSQRSGVFVGTAQLFGIALGPLLASMTTSHEDYGRVRWISIGSLLCVLLISGALHFSRRTSIAGAGIAGAAE